MLENCVKCQEIKQDKLFFLYILIEIVLTISDGEWPLQYNSDYTATYTLLHSHRK